ncbi:NAD(P)-binding domain-containing protein [Streptomyces sp. NPDC050625]|uniref:NAD(P)-dependent oxidoreductase n=1 Tax=Streptomyces sp. NPDC050625 TaxID=3154629 RepID=UPI003438026B
MTNTTDSTPVSVLGLGPMGRALASAFLTTGHPLTVWNRTPGRTGDLPERGAVVAGGVAEAVRGGRVIVVCLLDYAAVQAVLDPPPADWTGRVLVNLSSGRPAQARALARWAAGHGIRYLDGAILTPTPAMGTPSAAVLYSGAPDVHEAVRDTMAALGGTQVHVGEDPGRAAAHEVALLDLFATAVHGVAHAFALGSAEGVAPRDLAPFAAGIGGLLPELVTRFAGQLEAGDFPGERSTIGAAATTLGHLVEAAADRGLDTGALSAAKRAADRAVAAGHEAEGLARLATFLKSDEPV